jgi:molybdopterin/thiamine biosynthesis adenylyltransferase
MELSKTERDVYDRQIRLWGVDAQSKMTSSKLLVIGMTGLAAEVCKNLILAGINLTLGKLQHLPTCVFYVYSYSMLNANFKLTL